MFVASHSRLFMLHMYFFYLTDHCFMLYMFLCADECLNLHMLILYYRCLSHVTDVFCSVTDGLFGRRADERYEDGDVRRGSRPADATAQR